MTGAGESVLARLRRLAYEGATVRYGAVDETVRTRLELELNLIRRKGFAEHFLAVYDIVARLAGGDGRVRRGRSVTCGRGSGAASLVNYCLGVTNVDVIKHNLMFERFLNDARVDPPDIDVDFAWDERDGILDRVFATYGRDRVARVANHNRYDARGAIRTVARVFGYSDPEITRHMRESPSVYAEDSVPDPTPADDDPLPISLRARRRLDVMRRDGRSDWNDIARLSRRLIGIPHCLSMHCGGVTIPPGVLSRSVPTVISGKGQPTIQWEKDGSEDMGLVKIDLLGNRSLAVISDAIRDVSRAEGIPEDKVITDDLSDDPATRKLVEHGDTFGVFYLESPSMRLLMAKARRGDFAHAVVHSSTIRPAANASINEYLERLHGKPWEPEDPCLKGLFKESYGIPVYQEDVMRMAMALSGYDSVRADALRKCLGKRDVHERLTAAWPDLAAAARARDVNEKAIQSFWRTLMSMTGYSFCKPHSASYAQVSFEFIPGAHPLALYAEEIRDEARALARRSRPALIGAADLSEYIGKMAVIIAWPVTAKIVETKHGDTMMFQSFEDHQSLCEAVIFPEEFQRYHRLLGVRQPLWVTGRVLEEFGGVSLQGAAIRTAHRSRKALPPAENAPVALLDNRGAQP